MTEQNDTTPSSVVGAPEGPGATGHPQVDTVLQSLHALDNLPVDQHVAVFEAAHTGLREALSGAADAGVSRG